MRTESASKKERANPTKPQTSPPTGANDQTAIGHIPVEECCIRGVRHVEDIPSEFEEDWSHAYSSELKQANTQAESLANEEEQIRALKWQMVICHALLRDVNRGKPD